MSESILQLTAGPVAASPAAAPESIPSGPAVSFLQGGAAQSARLAHTQEVAGANPAPATSLPAPPLANDAHCLACGFEMLGGQYVGLCPKCGSHRWYRCGVANPNAGLVQAYPGGRWP